MTDHPDPVQEPTQRMEQTNHQTLHIHIHNGQQGADLNGRIAGSVALEADHSPVPGCMVELFFGPVGSYPVATARTDSSGRFSFEALPPGFYGLRLLLAEHQVVLLHNLRLLIGETAQPRILLPGPGPAPRFALAPNEACPEVMRYPRVQHDIS